MNTKSLMHVAAGLVLLGLTTGVFAQTPKSPTSGTTQPPPPPKRLADKAAMFSKAYRAQLCGDATKCEVTVKVGPLCAFTVTPWTIGIPSTFKNVKIRWVIDGSSSGKVQFAKDGISFKGPTKEFDQPRPGASEFRWNDKNELPGAPPNRPYDYAIKVTQDGKPCTLDPTIVNDY